MTNRTVRMTNLWVRKLSAPKRTDYRDSVQSGLILHVTPSGFKTWFVRYRAAGKQRRYKVGSYPEVSLSNARTLAGDVLRRIDKEEDPQAVRLEFRQRQVTVSDLVSTYIETHAKPTVRTWRKELRYLESDLLPVLGDTPAAAVSRSDIHRVLDRIASRGASTQVLRVRSLLHRVWEIGIDRELVETNPVYRLRRPEREKPWELRWSHDEIRAVWRALKSDNTVCGRAYRVLWLTAAREQEILKATREELDGPWLTVPAQRMKGRKGHRRSHRKYLVEEALEAVAPKGQWLFPSPKKDDRPVASMSTAMRRIKEVSGVATFNARALRKVAATALGELGFPEEVIAAVLAHSPRSVTGRHYNLHHYDTEKATALTAWRDHLLGIVHGRTRPKKVLSFQK